MSFVKCLLITLGIMLNAFACSTSPTDLLVHNDVCDAIFANGVTFPHGSAAITRDAMGVDPAVTLRVEIADSPAERSQGLMCRSHVESGEGMLFLFDTEQTSGFWMKNTSVALDIAYIDAHGRIVDIREMRPCTAPLDSAGHLTAEWPDEPTTCLQDQTSYDGGTYPAGYVPDHVYLNALEVPHGYFVSAGIRVGATVSPLLHPDIQGISIDVGHAQIGFFKRKSTLPVDVRCEG